MNTSVHTHIKVLGFENQKIGINPWNLKFMYMLTEHIHLSESRFRFLFKREVGQPVQRFMLWMKVIQSVNPILKGNQITQTAYEVGFWDSAHLNRSYNQLLGIAPSAIKKYEKDLKIIACEEGNFYTFKTEILKDWQSDQPYRIVEL